MYKYTSKIDNTAIRIYQGAQNLIFGVGDRQGTKQLQKGCFGVN
ncbi:hypothetical protein B3286c1_0698 [Brucella vulpis]|nr:hypothetical protein BF3285c1_0699 [Brucella vulpis]CUW49529.1 hypothetical protein B3286c1_0698 [Brucella vulpis]